MTLVTGLVDAFSYLALGHVFVANMTGNVVFLGFAVAGADGFSILASLVAGASFLMGLDRLARGKLVSEPPCGSTVDTRAASPMARACPAGLVRRRTAGGMSCLEH